MAFGKPGRPPSEKTLVDRYLNRNRANVNYPQIDNYAIPNHSGTENYEPLLDKVQELINASTPATDFELIAELYGQVDASGVETDLMTYNVNAGDFQSGDTIMIKLHHRGTSGPQSDIKVTCNSVNLNLSGNFTGSEAYGFVYISMTPLAVDTQNGTMIAQGSTAAPVQITRLSTADFGVDNWITTAFTITLAGLNAAGTSNHHALIYRIKGGSMVAFPSF